jgi:glyceraldehyde-3-phosphate dehydrogenase (NADP+)
LTDEVFGPVATLETCDDLAGLFDTLVRADHTLNVAVFTRSIETAFTVYEKANAGAVIVNDSTDFRIDAMPFGGVGGAGLGREGVRFAIEEMMEKKMMVFRRPLGNRIGA